MQYRYKKNSKMRNRERNNPEVPRLMRCLFPDLYPVRAEADVTARDGPSGAGCRLQATGGPTALQRTCNGSARRACARVA